VSSSRQDKFIGFKNLKYDNDSKMQDTMTNVLSINRHSMLTPARYSINNEIKIMNSEFRDGLTVMQTRKKKNLPMVNPQLFNYIDNSRYYNNLGDNRSSRIAAIKI